MLVLFWLNGFLFIRKNNWKISAMADPASVDHGENISPRARFLFVRKDNWKISTIADPASVDHGENISPRAKGTRWNRAVAASGFSRRRRSNG